MTEREESLSRSLRRVGHSWVSSVGRTAPAVVALVLVALLVFSPAVAVVVGQENTNSSESYGLEELRRNGNAPGESPDSVRLADGEKPRIWYVEHLPASNPAAQYPDSLEKLPEGHTLNRNEIYLRTIRVDHDDLTRKVNVVFWKKSTTKIEGENATRSEPSAEILSSQTHTISFGRGFAIEEIEFPVHDEPVHVTIWIEDEPGARWHFKHKSTATSQPANIDTQGDYWWAMFSDVLIWIIGGGLLVSWGVMKMIKRAAKGPGYGPIPYMIVLTLGFVFAVFVYYDSLSDLYVNAPYVVALFIVGMIGVFILETYSSGVRKVQFIQPTLSASTSPSGEDGFDFIDLKERTYSVVRMNDGRDAVVRKGVIPFLARVFGRAAILEGIGDLKTRANVVDSPHDEMYWIDPEADEILEFKPPGFSINLPEINASNIPKYAAGVGGLVFLGLMVAGGAVGPWSASAVVALVSAVVLLSPRDGYARVQPASAHQRSAFASMQYLDIEIENARTFDEAIEQLRRERARGLREVDEALEDHDTTIISEFFGDEISATVRNDDAEDRDIDHDTRGRGDDPRKNGSSSEERGEMPEADE